MKLVEVLSIPVRYNGVTYSKDATFEMEDAHVNETFVKVIGEVADKQTPFHQFENMTVDELKAYAKDRNINIGKTSTVEGIIKKIEDAQKAKKGGV